MDGAQCSLIGQAVPTSFELQPAGEVLSPFASPDKLHDGKELLVAVILLLLHQHQHQHEEEAEAGLHHHQVHLTRQVDVRGQVLCVSSYVEMDA